MGNVHSESAWLRSNHHEDRAADEQLEFGPLHGHEHSCTLIYLHAFKRAGWCDYQNDRFNWPWAETEYCVPGLRVVVPSANSLPQPWGETVFAWYTYQDESSNDVGDKETLTAVHGRLAELIRVETARLNGNASRIFLGGLSQGCTVGLDFYVRFAAQMDLGGFVGSVGFFPNDAYGFSGSTAAIESFIRSRDQAHRPLWLLCATDDDVEVPWECLVKPSLRLVEHRLPGLSLRTVSGRGHFIGTWEAEFLCAYFREHALATTDDTLDHDRLSPEWNEFKEYDDDQETETASDDSDTLSD